MKEILEYYNDIIPNKYHDLVKSIGKEQFSTREIETGLRTAPEELVEFVFALYFDNSTPWNEHFNFIRKLIPMSSKLIDKTYEAWSKLSDFDKIRVKINYLLYKINQSNLFDHLWVEYIKLHHIEYRVQLKKTGDKESTSFWLKVFVAILLGTVGFLGKKAYSTSLPDMRLRIQPLSKSPKSPTTKRHNSQYRHTSTRRHKTPSVQRHKRRRSSRLH